MSYEELMELVLPFIHYHQIQSPHIAHTITTVRCTEPATQTQEQVLLSNIPPF